MYKDGLVIGQDRRSSDAITNKILLAQDRIRRSSANKRKVDIARSAI